MGIQSATYTGASCLPGRILVGQGNDGGHASSAFVDGSLLSAKGEVVAHKRSVGAIVVGVLKVVIFGGAAPVVAGKDEQGILASPGIVQRLQDPSDGVI